MDCLFSEANQFLIKICILLLSLFQYINQFWIYIELISVLERHKMKVGQETKQQKTSRLFFWQVPESAPHPTPLAVR